MFQSMSSSIQNITSPSVSKIIGDVSKKRHEKTVVGWFNPLTPLDETDVFVSVKSILRHQFFFWLVVEPNPLKNMSQLGL